MQPYSPGPLSRPQLGFDFNQLLAGAANIGSQLNSIITGQPTSTIYRPTSIPLNASLDVSSWILPAAVVVGLVLLARKR